MKTAGYFKILHICYHFKTGGIRTFIRTIIELNDKFDTTHDLMIIREIEQNKIKYPCRVYDLNYKWERFFSTIKKARQIFKNYDSIMLHSAHPIIIFALFFSKKKIFFFQHGMAVSSGYLFKRILKKFWFSFLPIVLNAKTICSTKFAFKKARKLGIFLNPKRNIIIPFGVKINPEEKRIRNISNKDPIKIGMASSLTAKKRNDVLLRSLAAYSGRAGINLLIAGGGPELSNLKNIAKDIRSDRVKIDFLGQVDNMDRFYREIDFFVLPSKEESFGLVVLEALSRLIPVAVFSDVGGCLRYVKQEKTGIIMEDGTAALNNIWKMLNERPETIYSMSKFISDMNMDEYDIVNTRNKLDALVKSSIRYSTRIQ